MKLEKRNQALILRQEGYAINIIATKLNVAKSSVSLWVRDVILTETQLSELKKSPFSSAAIEKRRLARLTNEKEKRQLVINAARQSITSISNRELWLMGVMLYWAEGGKTQRMVRFSNRDPEMIIIMMKFFRQVCKVPESKFRGYIHIHPHLDFMEAERYWSEISNIPIEQFFKTYRKPNISSLVVKDSLPNGVMDIYVLDSNLFLKITGWSQGIFKTTKYPPNP